MKKIYFLLFTASVSFNLTSQTILTLPVLKDAAIGYHDGASTANNNYGYATQNAAYCIPATASTGVNMNRALIDFDLSLIPQSATIMSAYLNLYALGPFGSLPGHTGTNNTSYIERVTQNWLENTVTWNNQPTTTSLNQITLNQSTNSTQNYLNINVTSLVQDMKNNPTTSFGFKLKLISETSTNALAFGSKDHSNPALVPTLVITYSIGCGTTDSLVADYDAAIGYHDGASTANNNYGTAAQNAAYTIPSVAAPGGLNVNRALLHFDLSTIPANATITNAQLDLFAYGQAGSYPGHSGSANNAVIERVTGNWSENTVTWNNQPTSTSTNQVQLNGTTNPTLDYLNISVTQLVQDILTSQNNQGIILKLNAENPSNLMFFCSKDHSDSNKHPRLRVSYTCNNVSVKELNTSIASIICSPNPAKDVINFNVNTTKSGKGILSIIDVLGKTIKEIDLNISANQLNENISIDLKSLSSGLYHYSILFEGEQQSGKFIIE